jgi:spore maturation protein CgeB
MRFVMFYHSLVSDWNHGNAHFLRGVVSELMRGGHQVSVYEARDGWSLTNLVAEHGAAALDAFEHAYPELESQLYDVDSLDLDQALAGADVVMVHEWNEPALIRALGRHHARAGYTLLFHDTHHRAVSEPEHVARLGLESYDAVLAFGQVLRDLYLERGLCRRAFTWHEGADTRRFHPRLPARQGDGDLVWIGNWGDEERTAELEEFLIEPVRALGISARVFGVRYPPEARERLARAGIDYGGWLPNCEVPSVFSRYRVTVHIPRRWYTRALPGIPTIRPFEALACGIPLVSAPWDDREGLFVAGRDYLVAQDGAEMKAHLADLLAHPERGRAFSRWGQSCIRARHTCAHRTEELLRIVADLAKGPGREEPSIASMPGTEASP